MLMEQYLENFHILSNSFNDNVSYGANFWF